MCTKSNNKLCIHHHCKNRFSSAKAIRIQACKYILTVVHFHVIFYRILTARETALASRKHCVEEWMSWHAKLRAEEDRVTRMEQAALKLVAATSNVLFQQGNVLLHNIFYMK